MIASVTAQQGVCTNLKALYPHVTECKIELTLCHNVRLDNILNM